MTICFTFIRFLPYVGKLFQLGVELLKMLDIEMVFQIFLLGKAWIYYDSIALPPNLTIKILGNTI